MLHNVAIALYLRMSVEVFLDLPMSLRAAVAAKTSRIDAQLDRDGETFIGTGARKITDASTKLIKPWVGRISIHGWQRQE